MEVMSAEDFFFFLYFLLLLLCSIDSRGNKLSVKDRRPVSFFFLMDRDLSIRVYLPISLSRYFCVNISSSDEDRRVVSLHRHHFGCLHVCRTFSELSSSLCLLLLLHFFLRFPSYNHLLSPDSLQCLSSHSLSLSPLYITLFSMTTATPLSPSSLSLLPFCPLSIYLLFFLFFFSFFLFSRSSGGDVCSSVCSPSSSYLLQRSYLFVDSL